MKDQDSGQAGAGEEKREALPLTPLVWKERVQAWRRVVEQGREFWIFSHVRPDGDACGCTLGLGLALEAAGKKVRMFNEDGLTPRYAFLPESRRLEKAPAQPPAGEAVIIAVDTAEAYRLGPTFQHWSRKVDVNIDHHISNTQFGQLNLIDPEAPATAEILFDLIQAAGLSCSPAVAGNLFVGISTDTGSFRHRQTTARTFEVAAALIRAGADPTQLALSAYQSHPLSRLLLLREILNGLQLHADECIASVRLSRAIFERSGADADQVEGLLEYIQMVKKVEVALLVEALSDGTSRASLRSRGCVDVQKVAQLFGGGGHQLAAGVRSKLSAQELEAGLVAAVAEALKGMPAAASGTGACRDGWSGLTATQRLPDASVRS